MKPRSRDLFFLTMKTIRASVTFNAKQNGHITWRCLCVQVNLKTSLVHGMVMRMQVKRFQMVPHLTGKRSLMCREWIKGAKPL